jgi:hypothetical protein
VRLSGRSGNCHYAGSAPGRVKGAPAASAASVPLTRPSRGPQRASLRVGVEALPQNSDRSDGLPGRRQLHACGERIGTKQQRLCDD